MKKIIIATICLATFWHASAQQDSIPKYHIAQLDSFPEVQAKWAKLLEHWQHHQQEMNEFVELVRAFQKVPRGWPWGITRDGQILFTEPKKQGQ